MESKFRLFNVNVDVQKSLHFLPTLHAKSAASANDAKHSTCKKANKMRFSSNYEENRNSF